MSKVTLNLNAPALMELIESNPEVELDIAKGTVANLASMVARKMLNSPECVEIVKAAGKEAKALVSAQFEKVSSANHFFNPRVTLTKKQCGLITRKTEGAVRSVVAEVLSEEKSKRPYRSTSHTLQWSI